MKFPSFLRTTFLWILLLPYAFTFAGAASNQLVIIANDGKFPVQINIVKAHEFMPDNPLPDGMIDDIHCVMTTRTHLNYLADIFDFHTSIKSIGDIALDLGAWLEPLCPIVYLTLVTAKLREED